jgi:phosphatidylglycerol:prolipoprotein diacylglycerol transferase
VFRTTHGHVVVPTQLFEAVFLLTLSSILILLAFKKETLLTLPIYMISYGIWRFLIEFLRDDHRGNFIPGITPSQFWAIVLFIGGVTYLVILLKSKKTHMRDYELPYNEAAKTQE